MTSNYKYRPSGCVSNAVVVMVRHLRVDRAKCTPSTKRGLTLLEQRGLIEYTGRGVNRCYKPTPALFDLAEEVGILKDGFLVDKELQWMLITSGGQGNASHIYTHWPRRCRDEACAYCNPRQQPRQRSQAASVGV